MAMSIPSMHTPRPHSQGICQLFNILLVPGGRDLSENCCPGMGICQFSSKQFISFLFQYFTKKYTY